MAQNTDLSPVPQVERIPTQGSDKMQMLSVLTDMFFGLSFFFVTSKCHKSDNSVGKPGASLGSF